MPKYFLHPFANNGDRVAVPDESVTDEVSYEQGYTPAYELPKENPDRRNIDRQPFNGALFAVTENLKFWQENGAPEIVADDGSGSPLSYSKGFVGSLGGVRYAALVDGTTTVPPSAEWEEIDLSTLNQRVIYVGSVAELEALDVPAGVSVQTQGEVTAGDGGERLYRIVEGSTGSADGFLYVDLNNGNQAELIRGTAISDVEVGIPSQFADPKTAFDFCFPRIDLGNEIKVRLNLETGYELSSGFLVSGVDASGYEITSDDVVVNVVATGFVGVTGVSSVGERENGLFVGDNATYPTINVLVDMNDQGGPGLFLTNNSKGQVKAEKGIDNAGTNGIILDNRSECNAPTAYFRFSNTGNRVTTGSYLNAPGIDLQGMKTAPGGGACLDVSRGSIINIAVPGGGAGASNLSGGAERGLAARRSHVSADGVNVSGNAAQGIRSENGSVISAADANASNCGGDALAAFSGSTLNANNSDATNSGASGIFAGDSSTINARSVTVEGYTSSGVISDGGSSVNFRDGEARQDGVNTSTNDIRVIRGSTISAHGSSGGTNISINTLDAAGIIYR